jgi:hypothetical protein
MAPAFSYRSPPKQRGGGSTADEPSELIDVPAAVVCALCGEADCPGCRVDDQWDGASGVLVFVPWERPEKPTLKRFAETARVTTEGAESFFGELPSGPLLPALRFAAVGELLAVGSTAALCALIAFGLGYLLWPDLVSFIGQNAILRAKFARTLSVAWLAFTAVLLLTRATYGVALYQASRREGAPRHLLRAALRFGLYGAGWDFMTSPLGALWLAVSDGRKAPRRLARYALQTPGRATTAFMRGIFQLEGAPAKRARRRALAITMTTAVVSIIAGMTFVALSLLR